MIAQGSDMAHLTHRAYAHGLNLTYLIAAGLGLIAAIAVFAFLRPGHSAPDRQQAPDGRPARPLAGTGRKP